MRNAPSFNDGVLWLYRVVQEPIGDYPRDVLEPFCGPIWYRELAVYDKTRLALEEAGKRITRKVAIPMFREVDSHMWAKVDGEFSQVFNILHTTDRDGFPMTELTLIEPENILREDGDTNDEN